MAVFDEQVSVATSDDGIPLALEWRRVHYDVTDTPTVWANSCGWWRPFGSATFGYGSIPREIGGWRFQATDAAGLSRVFDVRHASEGWRLVRVFE